MSLEPNIIFADVNFESADSITIFIYCGGWPKILDLPGKPKKNMTEAVSAYFVPVSFG